MAEFVRVASTSDVLPGTAKVVEVGDHRLAICNVNGEFFCIDDVCTHDGGPLGEGELYDDEIECPRHGAHFNVRTGAAVSFPAVYPVKTYEVKLEGAAIKVAIE